MLCAKCYRTMYVSVIILEGDPLWHPYLQSVCVLYVLHLVVQPWIVQWSYCCWWRFPIFDRRKYKECLEVCTEIDFKFVLLVGLYWLRLLGHFLFPRGAYCIDIFCGQLLTASWVYAASLAASPVTIIFEMPWSPTMYFSGVNPILGRNSCVWNWQVICVYFF